MPKQLPNTLKRTQNGHKSTLNEAVLQVFHRFSLLFVDLHDLLVALVADVAVDELRQRVLVALGLEVPLVGQLDAHGLGQREELQGAHYEVALATAQVYKDTCHTMEI